MICQQEMIYYRIKIRKCKNDPENEKNHQNPAENVKK